VLDADPNPDDLTGRRRGVAAHDVDDARASAAHLRALAGSWLVELEYRRDGLSGTLIDPDGNYIQFLEVSARYDASRGR
jgi:hypothetical protein